MNPGSPQRKPLVGLFVGVILCLIPAEQQQASSAPVEQVALAFGVHQFKPGESGEHFY